MARGRRGEGGNTGSWGSARWDPGSPATGWGAQDREDDRWDTGGWDQGGDGWAGPGEEELDGGSLPTVRSGGLPPWEQPGWEEAADDEGYGPRDRQSPGPSYSGARRGEFGREADGYDEAPYREDGGYRTGEYGPGGAAAGGQYAEEEFTTGEFDAGGYDTGGFAAGSYDTGEYAAYSPDDAYPPGGARPPGEAYRAADPYQGGEAYGGDDDYPGADDESYTGYQDAYRDYGEDPRRDGARGREYRRSGGWYGDVGDNQDWAEEEYEEDFLPGLKGAAASIRSENRTAARAGDRGRPGAGDRGRPGAGGGKPKRKRGMRRAAPWLALTFLLILFGGAGGGYYYVYRTYLHPPDYSGSGTGSVVIQIKSGETAAAIGQILWRAGVVASPRAFANAAKASPRGSSLEPGYYRLHKHMQASLALQMLLNPSSRFVYTVAIPEGFRLSQIIARLGAQTHDLTGYQQAIKNTSALGLPSYAHGNPEGYLFPATYQISPGTPPVKVLQQMVQRFNQEAASVNLPKWATHDQVTQAQIIVVASLVQAEGRRLSDFPKIARVIYNRLNAGMQLQLDSTVMYALHTDGIAATQRQLQAAKKSPYDTYTHYGLPPGPIDSPGDSAIKAALHPARGDWLYFVTVDPKTGLTKFTSDFNQFSQWEAQFRAAIAKGGG